MNKVIQGDCLEVMKDIPDKSIDMILCDLPYGTTACKWDTIIPFEPLWEQYKRIIKDNGAIVLTASQPFTSALVMSNPNMYSHQWIWEKNGAGNSLLVNIAPLKNFEDVLVFIKNQDEEYNNDSRREVLRKISEKYGKEYIIELFKKEGRYTSDLSARVHASYKFGFSNGLRFDLMDRKLFDFLSQYLDFDFDYSFFQRSETRENAAIRRTYNPQGVIEINKPKVVGKKPTHIGERPNQEGKEYLQKYTNYPKAIIRFDKDSKELHPTQKPVALFEYLIKTYTNEGDTVLDNCAGSGTTAIACINTKRNYILIEKEPEYIEIINKRIKDLEIQLNLL
jgi:DNA modification methylase